MILDALVIQIVIEVIDAERVLIVGIGDVIDIHGKVVVAINLRGHLDTAISKRGIDRTKLCIVYIDVFQDDLDLVLGNRPGHRALSTNVLT